MNGDVNLEARTRELLGDAYPQAERSFDAGFVDRVMARVAAQPVENELTIVMFRQLRRVVPALLAASVFLAAWNFRATRDSNDSLVQAALGISAPIQQTDAPLTTLEGAEVFQ